MRKSSCLGQFEPTEVDTNQDNKKLWKTSPEEKAKLWAEISQRNETLGCEEGMQILPVWHQTLKFSAFPGDLQESDPETGRVTSDINPCVKSFCEDNEVQAEFELC